MKHVKEQAQAIAETLVEDRRALHKIPEIGFEIPKTAAYVKERLTQLGIEHRDCGRLDEETMNHYVAAGFPRQEKATGIVATIGHGKPCILLRADMDALPMPETNDVEYRSTHEGRMHSCGHDAHTAMLLGAAKILNEQEASLKGTVKLMFQIGEEWGYGARLMIDDGLLENPTVDAAFAIHVEPDEDVGIVHYAKHVTSSSFDSYILNIQGKGGHSSMPEKCIDPVLIANQVTSALNILPGRETNPASLISFTVGSVQGGTASNIIPDTAKMQFGMRTYDPEGRDHLKERIPEIVDHTVKMWRGDYELLSFNTPSTANDPALVEELLPFIGEVVGEDHLVEFSGVPASEDFGHVSEAVPGCYVMLGAGKKGAYPVHNPNMVLDESTLPLGAAIHANVAMKWLEAHKED